LCTFYRFINSKLSYKSGVVLLKAPSGDITVDGPEKTELLNNYFDSTFTVDDGNLHLQSNLVISNSYNLNFRLYRGRTLDPATSHYKSWKRHRFIEHGYIEHAALSSRVHVIVYIEVNTSNSRRPSAGRTVKCATPHRQQCQAIDRPPL